MVNGEMQVVLLSRDLMIVSRVGGAVAKQNYSLLTADNADAAFSACCQVSTALLLVDLQIGNVDLAALINDLRQQCDPSPKIIAFGPHVHDTRLEAARAAGCDLVSSRGGFDRELDSWLEQLAA